MDRKKLLEYKLYIFVLMAVSSFYIILFSVAYVLPDMFNLYALLSGILLAILAWIPLDLAIMDLVAIYRDNPKEDLIDDLYLSLVICISVTLIFFVILVAFIREMTLFTAMLLLLLVVYSFFYGVLGTFLSIYLLKNAEQDKAQTKQKSKTDQYLNLLAGGAGVAGVWGYVIFIGLILSGEQNFNGVCSISSLITAGIFICYVIYHVATKEDSELEVKE